MEDETLRPFQRRFLAHATAPGIDTAVLSLPRGNGKSWLAANLAVRVLTPEDGMFVEGTESVLCAASIEQARIVFRFAKDILEPRGGYRFLDSHTRIGIHHLDTGTRLRVIGSNGKTAMGLVQCPWVIADEPGSWEVNGGRIVNDAIETAKGKPGSPLRALYIGTLAPALDGWWHDLVARGSHDSTYVQSLRGSPKKWDKWPEIRRCNPLTQISADFRKKLLEERNEARRDTRLKARFLSYRLNCPTADESEVLLTVEDWDRVQARQVAPREGRPMFAYDLGGGRAWSAAVAIWPTGRCECLAVAPGIPDLETQEKRDRAPGGLYRKLANSYNGRLLMVADGLRVPPPALLHGAALDAWGSPEVIYCDRFRFAELADAVQGSRLVPRITRWSEAADDIRGLRKLSKDGPLSVEIESRELLGASLASARVKNDDQGSVRLIKLGNNNTARDDVAAAWVLVVGAFARWQRRPSAAPLRAVLVG